MLTTYALAIGGVAFASCSAAYLYSTTLYQYVHMLIALAQSVITLTFIGAVIMAHQKQKTAFGVWCCLRCTETRRAFELNQVHVVGADHAFA